VFLKLPVGLTIIAGKLPVSYRDIAVTYSHQSEVFIMLYSVECGR